MAAQNSPRVTGRGRPSFTEAGAGAPDARARAGRYPHPGATTTRRTRGNSRGGRPLGQSPSIGGAARRAGTISASELERGEVRNVDAAHLSTTAGADAVPSRSGDVRSTDRLFRRHPAPDPRRPRPHHRAGGPQRVFTAHQRRAIIARDGGCVIPGCHVPAAWCEMHHAIGHAQRGPTHTDNGVLVCWFHHRTLDTSGWEIRMRDWLPETRAPSWVDALMAMATGAPTRASARHARRGTGVRVGPGRARPGRLGHR